LERVTAFLAQAAAALLAVTVLIGVLSYSHGAFYKRGYCSANYDPYDPYCQTDGLFGDLWPFGGDSAPAQQPAANPTGQPYGTQPYGSTGYTGQADPPPSVGGGTGGFGSSTGAPAGGSTYTPGTLPPPSGGLGQPVDGFGTQPPSPFDTSGSSGLPLSNVVPGVRPGDQPAGGYAPGTAAPGGFGSTTGGYGSTGGGFTSGFGGFGFGGPIGRSICVRPNQRPGPPGDPNIDQVTVAEQARCFLNIGDAYFVVDQVEQAQQHWQEALQLGATQASVTAQLRLQSAALERSCPTSLASLGRIAYGFDTTAEGGEVIDLWMRQQALSALGYYTGEPDGSYGPITRRAVRDFQADMGYDQTGALTASETVSLMCHSALTARDPASQNHLGVMFATGLGVIQNVDMALEWLERAASRGHDGANYNLAIIYGTGAVRGSWRLCGVVESPERADSYLRRAAELGHPRAQYLRESAQFRGPANRRWQRIRERLIEEAVEAEDRFYLAWLRRIDEARRANVRDQYNTAVFQAGCFYEPNPELEVQDVNAIANEVDRLEDYVDLRHSSTPDHARRNEIRGAAQTEDPDQR
jgi:TPR repeat protein